MAPERTPEALLADHGFAVRSLVPLAGDLSQRRYFRSGLQSGGSAVLALYPEGLREECGRFLTSGALLAEAGVRVPRVLAGDSSAGWTLLEDLGEWTLAEAPGLGDREVADYFGRAGATIARIQTIPPQRVATLNPPLDGGLLRCELEQTERELLKPVGLVEAAHSAALTTALDRLCEAIDRDPRVPCHRDFMVRNLMPIGPPPSLAVLDHQGLRLGPALYDLASLLNDTLFLPTEHERELLERLLRSDQERLAFHRAAAQRTLKAAGTYAHFLRRGLRRHAPLIAPTLDRAIAHLTLVPETVDAARRLADLWAPRRGLSDLLC
jgi:hypothetical protein